MAGCRPTHENTRRETGNNRDNQSCPLNGGMAGIRACRKVGSEKTASGGSRGSGRCHAGAALQKDMDCGALLGGLSTKDQRARRATEFYRYAALSAFPAGALPPLPLPAAFAAPPATNEAERRQRRGVCAAYEACGVPRSCAVFSSVVAGSYALAQCCSYCLHRMPVRFRHGATSKKGIRWQAEEAEMGIRRHEEKKTANWKAKRGDACSRSRHQPATATVYASVNRLVWRARSVTQI